MFRIIIGLLLALTLITPAYASDCADTVIAGMSTTTIEAQQAAYNCMSGVSPGMTPQIMLEQVQANGLVPVKVTRASDTLGSKGEWYVFYVIQEDHNVVWYVLTVFDGKVVNLE